MIAWQEQVVHSSTLTSSAAKIPATSTTHTYIRANARHLDTGGLHFLAGRTNGHAYGTSLCSSVSQSSVCDIMCCRWTVRLTEKKMSEEANVVAHLLLQTVFFRWYELFTGNILGRAKKRTFAVASDVLKTNLLQVFCKRRLQLQKYIFYTRRAEKSDYLWACIT